MLRMNDSIYRMMLINIKEKRYLFFRLEIIYRELDRQVTSNSHSKSNTTKAQ